MFKNLFKLMLYFLGFIALGAVASFLIFKLVSFGKTVEVPLLTGKSVSEASTLLSDIGLSLGVQGEAYDADIVSGKIIRQEAKPGEKVEKGSSIMVIISQGKAVIAIPYFEGMDIEDAKLTLKRLGMETGKITRVHSDAEQKNVIIAQRPLPGYSDGNKVNFLVSLGPYDVSYKCPLFIDMTADEARVLAKTLGLKLREKDSGSVVVFQKPESGAIVKKGDTVEITLGRRGGVWF